MFKQELEKARDAMRIGGISPKFVNRTVRELKDHYDDLTQSGLANGLSEQEAREQAGDKIGSLHQIVEAALSKKELKSFAYVYPKTVFLLTPLLSFILSIAATFLLVVGLVTVLIALNPDFPGYPVASWFAFLLQGVVLFNEYIIPIVLAVLYIRMARVRHIAFSIQVSSMLLIGFIGSMLNVRLFFPEAPGDDGGIGAMVNFIGFVPGPNNFSPELMVKSVLRVFLILAAAACTLWWINIRNKPLKDVNGQEL